MSIRPTPCAPAMVATLAMRAVNDMGTPLIATGTPFSKRSSM